MTNFIIIVLVAIIQIILSVNLIIRQKNNIAVIEEIGLALLLFFILNEMKLGISQSIWFNILYVLGEYLFVKLFLILFMLEARKISFRLIKKVSQNRYKKHKNLKCIGKFYKAKYWPRLKLGLPGMAGRTHSITKVRFDEKGFPKFKSYYTVKLKKKDFRKTRELHFYIANKLLYKKMLSSSRPKLKFSNKQMKQLYQGDTPNGYVWHHHQDSGVLQLVDETIHARTHHSGGYSIWGGK